MSLPTELHYAICRNVTSRGDLRRIAASSRSLQRPAEAALHQSVTLISRSAAFGVADILRRHPRFQSLVKSLRIELDIRCSQDATRNYWKELEEMIASLTALEHLNIQDGLDRPLAWVLRGIQPNQLKSLQCSFILDEDLVRVLKDQQNISDLSLKTSIVHLPFRRDYLHQVRVPETTDDIDERFHRAIKHLLESALPQLKYLHTESLALARALVPGRPVTHIWVPGASFSTSVSTAFLYQHIHVVHQDGLPEVEKHSYSSESGDSEETLALQHAGPSLHTSVEAHVSYLKTVLEAFAQSSEDVVSLRMALNLSEEGLYQVLSHMAKVLPRIRVLSFLPSYAVEPSSSDTERGQRNDNASPIRLPSFKHLHTLCVWSTPSRRALTALGEASETLPELQTLACLHFSQPYEWICLPVRCQHQRGTDGCVGVRRDWRSGGSAVPWEYDFWKCKDKLHEDPRRATPMHDSENRLWRWA